ncbi:MAG: L-seryl-tRNA(Sec) selenium transferase [Oscillospiraceae bacterium]|nr:L-seryl-tRNA(Sec) selenium transferase [Oscillospiraceae bacterium]
MAEKNEILRSIPKMDELLRLSVLAELNAAQASITEAARETVENFRREVLAGNITEVVSAEELAQQIVRRVKQLEQPAFRPIVNATGVSLHTNLGRACLSKRAADAVYGVVSRYTNLEYNIEEGRRGSRYDHVKNLLTKVTGAESALVVNNNASAVLLILCAMANKGEVICSRGELVEIGGAFRVPEIMQQCGCYLKEVGATNKTHLKDYVNAITENTKALLKVHTSNFKIVGFTDSVSLVDMVKLGREKGLPVIEDLGSGSLVDLEQFGIHDEPTVQNSVRAGVDVISFSGDKLLGGPQAGIIIGKKQYIDIIKRHPLNRAVRVDKMTLAALEATLRSYAEGEEQAKKEIPVLSMLGAKVEDLRAKAEYLATMIRSRGTECEVRSEEDQVGGGSVPTQLLPTFAVALSPKNCSVDGLEQRLRLRELPIVGRIHDGVYLLSVRTMEEKDFAYVAEAVSEAMNG